MLWTAPTGGTNLADLKASSPIDEYLADAWLASFARISATASSVRISYWARFLSISFEGEEEICEIIHVGRERRRQGKQIVDPIL
jgi:hypothetical protein